jgi:hypothetical protein
VKNWEALKALSDGKCVRQKHGWVPGLHIGPFCQRSPGHWGYTAEWHLVHDADGWEIYEPDEPDEPGHDWEWVLGKLLANVSVRRRGYDITLTPNGGGFTSSGLLFPLDIDATDWVVAKPTERNEP